MKKIMFLVFTFSLLLVTGCGNSTSNHITWKCKDVTSYDHNRNNDMKCTSSDGVVKYTSYEGAKTLESL